MPTSMPRAKLTSEVTDYVPIYGATLGRASTFAELFEDAAQMNAASPVFTTAVDPKKFNATAVGNQGSNLRIATVEGFACYVLAFCLQIGHAQFIWLADPTDPEFRLAIDKAKSSGQLGFAFLSPREPWFLATGVPPDGLAFERLRTEEGQGSEAFAYSAMLMMHAGEIEERFADMLPGVELNYRRTCVLLTSEVTKAMMSIPGAVIERAAPVSAAT
ncbi:hypothetical protein SAMN04487926_14537 [Paraburkholderia steynii]|uniref:Uncharacterized protein n=1 Tax=Paraburkholderia steynii TaxID=1245441 RepID=A0A7Z7BJ51_9BURK|nr:hypothetical protein [Paraburkholderia steynii]SDJ36593.1 hypothetical protein SAMN04487926_14537 [Paraburkholderia steynii]